MSSQQIKSWDSQIEQNMFKHTTYNVNTVQNEETYPFLLHTQVPTNCKKHLGTPQHRVPISQEILTFVSQKR